MPRAYTPKVAAACARCGRVTLYRPCEVRKFCSPVCYAQSRIGTGTGAKTTQSCAWCGGEYTKLTSQIGRYCSKPCTDAAKVQPVAERFWSKVNKNGPVPAHRPELGPCWPWAAGLDSHGYGKFWLAGRTVHAHAVAYELIHGPLPIGHGACHHCDNPPCCNPDHLFPGTPKDNTQDMIQKGRRYAGGPRSPATGERHGSHLHPERVARGERSGQAKLTAADVRMIRAKRAAGIPGVRVAAEFGITPTQVSAIWRRHSWQHVE